MIKPKRNGILNLIMGAISILLPCVIAIVCFIFDEFIPQSISSSYYTSSRWIFISMMIIVALIFFFTKTPSKIENIYQYVLGSLVMLIVIFPTRTGSPDDSVGFFQIDPNVSGVFHSLSAVLFFFFLSFYIFYFIPRHKNDKHGLILSRIVGIAIFVLTFFLMIGYLMKLGNFFPFNYITESLILVAFGFPVLRYAIKDLKKQISKKKSN